MLGLIAAAVLGSLGGGPPTLPYKCTFYVADVQYVSDPQTAAYRDRVKIWLRLHRRDTESTIFVIERPDFADAAAVARYEVAVGAYLALLTRALGRRDIGVEPDIEQGQTGDGTDANPYVLGSLSTGAGSQIGVCNSDRRGR